MTGHRTEQRRFPAVIPRWAVWAIFVFAGGAWVLQAVFILWIRYVVAPFVEFGDLILPHSMHVLALAAISVGYGIYRALIFHPLINLPYGVWLAQTPWRYPQPLPLGPVHLVWQDAILVGAMTLFAFSPPYRGAAPLYVPILFISVYVVGLCMVHWRAGIAGPTFACLSLAGAVMLFEGSALVAAAALVASLCLATYPIGSVLREFPFSRERRAELKLLPYRPPLSVPMNLPNGPQEAAPGWLKTIREHAARISLTIGWLMFCTAYPIRDSPDTSANLLFFGRLIPGVLIAGRILVYCASHWPPISIFGRFVTGRLIIPGYDKVFVAPLLAAAVAFFLPRVLINAGMASFIAFPIATAIATWLVLTMPPDFEEWQLTGHHRIAWSVRSAWLQSAETKRNRD